MKRYLVAILLGLSLAPVALAQPLGYGSCGLINTCMPGGSYANASTAFIGQVVAVETRQENVLQRRDREGNMVPVGDVYAVHTVDVQEVLKGQPSSRVRVETLVSCADGIGEGSAPLEVGRAYGFALSSSGSDTFAYHGLGCGEYGVTTPENLKAAFAAKGDPPIGWLPIAFAGAGILLLIALLLFLRRKRRKTENSLSR